MPSRIDALAPMRRRRPVFDFIIVVAIVVLLFIAFELGLRITFRHSMNFDIEMWKYANELKRVAPDPAIGHEHVPGQRAHLMGVDIVINGQKLRDHETPFEKPVGEVRVLMLGDSLTFGWGVSFEDTTSQLLEGLLQARAAPGLRVRVINAGVGNYNTVQEIAYFLREGYRYDPDVVVLNYFINDAEPVPTKRTVPILSDTYTYVFLMGRFDVLRREIAGDPSWKQYYRYLYSDGTGGWIAVMKSLAKLAVYCRAQKIGLLVAHYPELHVLDDYPFKGVRDRLHAAADEIGARFIDLYPAVAGKQASSLWVSPTDAHPNGTANRLFAEHLVARVGSMLRDGGSPDAEGAGRGNTTR